MSEMQLQNPEGVARTPTGEIVDQGATPTTPEPTKTEPEPSLLNKDLPKEPAKPEAKVPEKYEFAPPKEWEGKDWQLAPDVIEKATPLFKDLGLSNEQAQKLVNFYALESQRDHEASLNLVREQNEQWQSKVKADPEIGGKLDQVKTTVARAIDGVGDPALAAEFREAMDFTGAGNNPAFIKMFYKLAQKLTEGTPVSGLGPSPAGQGGPPRRPSAAEAIYPNLSRRT